MQENPFTSSTCKGILLYCIYSCILNGLFIKDDFALARNPSKTISDNLFAFNKNSFYFLEIF